MRGTRGWESAKIKELIVPGVPINQTGFLMDASSDTGVWIGVDFMPESIGEGSGPGEDDGAHQIFPWRIH